ncbi:hypothetical protein AYI69_g3329 [Smittium culicis]|uniref:Endonuclease/exonuclease/phosphatase domain-containing protein n=1 Tax=Smittium culicis TaxID=133412 RepID=A0A1R1YK20_9FUNG|nr:hypothetical protein AYI69_g3329 [Smittium culicis]
MIDHIFYVGLKSRPNWCTANHFLDQSDHMPITAQWNIDSLEVPEKMLADGNLAIDELCDGLIDNIWNQSARLSATAAPGEVFKTMLSKNAINKIKIRRKKFKKLKRKKEPMKKYANAKLAAIDAIKADRKAHHAKNLKLIADQLLNNSSKEYWRYIKSCTGNTLHSVSNGPVDLAKDTTVNSRDPSKWQELLSDDSDYFPECDHRIIWTDITAALNDTPNNKAPGADGVPREIW